MAISDQEWNRLKEIVEVLAGMRGDKNKAALRHSDLGGIDNNIGSARAGNKEISTTLKNLNSQVEQLRLSVSSLRGDVDTNASDIDAAEQALAGVQQTIASLSQLVSTHGDTLTSLQQQVQQAATAASNAQGDIDSVQTRVNAVSMPDPVQGNAVAAPTKAEFDGLVADVRASHDQIKAIKAAIVG